MAGKYKRYDKCPAYQCPNNITHVMVYGCLDGHINEIYGCHTHIEYYRSILPHYHCGTCGLQWGEEHIIGELWTAATTH